MPASPAAALRGERLLGDHSLVFREEALLGSEHPRKVCVDQKLRHVRPRVGGVVVEDDAQEIQQTRLRPYACQLPSETSPHASLQESTQGRFEITPPGP